MFRVSSEIKNSYNSFDLVFFQSITGLLFHKLICYDIILSIQKSVYFEGDLDFQ